LKDQRSKYKSLSSNLISGREGIFSDRKNYKDGVAIWTKFTLLQAKLADTLGIPYIFFVQPSIFRYKSLTKFETKLYEKYRMDNFDWIEKLESAQLYLSKKSVNVFSLMKIFSDTHKKVYFDYCHLNNFGNRTLIKEIVSRIKSSGVLENRANIKN
jgi:hypothetical protein